MSVVLITGCSSGFGKLAALEFARQGQRVFASMRNLSKADALRSEAASENLNVDIIQLDVNDDASVRAAVDTVLQQAGRIDVLVNNAGIGAVAPVEEFDEDEIRALFETNVFGLLRVTRAVVPHLREQGSGRVINVGSLAGKVVSPFRGIYGATKHAVEALTDAMYYELHAFGVHVAVIEPGFFETDITANRMPVRRFHEGSSYADLERRFGEAFEGPSTRPGPEPVAHAIVEAATAPEPRRRYLVGGDAEAIGALHKRLSDEEFEKAMRTTLNFWD